MIRVSSKFAPALIALLGAASALRMTTLQDARAADPCASPGALKATSLISDTVALGERLEAIDATTIQWSEGEVAHPLAPKLPMKFHLIRSYDAAALYDNPIHYAEPPPDPAPSADADARAAEERSRQRARLQPEALSVREVASGDTRLPIHLAWDRTAVPSRLVAWFFVFDNAPVESPLRSQLANALNLAVGGARPLTLVTIAAVSSPQSEGVVEDAAVAWLSNAWSYIAHSCEPR
ncbi:MAG TPA: hypothetical protein VII78_03000 [Myxococcota bacterium]